jgi:hypothetical protein
MTTSAGASPKSSPRLFISYSWTNPDHEAWVLNLATELRQSGVDVILDKWDLKEGHDAYAFMEKMVTDPDIKKVILVCDKKYTEKADLRSGGVGTEAQIISPEIYSKKAQDKFVAVIKERDDSGKPYVPAYYRSRIHIDLSDSNLYTENFETLVRWAFDQPLHKKPGLGAKPQYLVDEGVGAPALATGIPLRRALDAIRNDKTYAIPATTEYLSTLAKELEKLRLDPKSDPFDEALVKSIDSFLPYRNEAISLFAALALHTDSPEVRTAVHRFFEEIIPYMEWPGTLSTYREWDWDNFKFIVHELFLYAVAIFIRQERFETAAFLTDNHYYLPTRKRLGDDPMPSFANIWQFMKSLELRNQRCNLRRLSLRADLLKERSTQSGVKWEHLAQADFVLFMRSKIDLGFHHWRPDTLIFNSFLHTTQAPFEIFARARSKAYFDRLKVMLGVDSKERLAEVVESIQGDPSYPRWGYESFNAAALLGLEQLATQK